MLSYMEEAFDHSISRISDSETEEYKDPTFLDYLLEAGFDYLFPEEGFSGRFFEDDGCGEDDDPKDREVEIWSDDEDPVYLGSQHVDHIYSDEEYDGYKQGNTTERLMQIFQMTDVSQEEFLKMTPWQVLGLTAHQFHKIDASQLDEHSFEMFVTKMLDPLICSALPAYNKRIAYCILMANGVNTGFRSYDEEIIYITDRLMDKTLPASLMRLQVYQDYQSMLPEARAYNRLLAQLPEDQRDHEIYDYPRFPKPSTLKDWHDKARRDHMAFETTLPQAQEYQETDLNEEIKERVKTPDYLRFLYHSDRYSVIAVKDQDDLRREADTLDNCLRTYAPALASGASYIYFIRDNNKIDTSLYAVEIRQQNEAAILTQAYTYHNSTEKTEDLKNFIFMWCTEKHIKIRCPI